MGGCNPAELKAELLYRAERMDSLHLSAFYSSPRVAEIMERLYAEWERSGRRGEPIDYATCEELALLLREAEKAEKMPAWRILRKLAYNEE